MPYIPQEDRILLKEIEKVIPITKGELEYCIFKLMVQFMKNKTANYSNLHDATYAAHHAADEFRRRYLDKREDEAIKINGDIL